MTTETPAAATTAPTAESAPATQPGAEKPDGLEEQAGASPEGETTAAKEGEQKSGTPKGVQKRLDELTRQRSEAQRVNERLLGILEQTLTKGKAPEVDLPAGPPRRDQFETYEAYLEARTDFQVAQSVKTIEHKAERSRQEAAVAAVTQGWQTKVDGEAAKDDEFAGYIDEVGTKISLPAGRAVMESDLGVEIVRHLGQNPAERDRIAALSPVAQVREIGKIEARLEAKKAEPARQASKAPPPIETVGGGKGGGGSNLENAQSQAQYEAMRAQQGAWWSQGRK